MAEEEINQSNEQLDNEEQNIIVEAGEKYEQVIKDLDMLDDECNQQIDEIIKNNPININILNDNMLNEMKLLY